MPTEVLRCTECNAPLRSVPSWMTSTKVKFTCNSCPKRSSRASAAARFDTPIEVPARVIGDPDMDADEVPEADEDIDMEVSIEDLDDPKDDKEVE